MMKIRKSADLDIGRVLRKLMITASPGGYGGDASELPLAGNDA